VKCELSPPEIFVSHRNAPLSETGRLRLVRCVVEGGWPLRRANAHRQPLQGYQFLHTAIDGHSRLAYSELLADELKETAAAFWARANAWFGECGITVRTVLTDNRSCYRSTPFADALGEVQHVRTRPCRPLTNGKVERFHRTLADEWAYAPYRSDSALGGKPGRQPRNLSGQNN
jgi:transposase InsO family protein